MTKTIMVNAWNIARKAAAQFGGKAIQYIANAMKQAWKEYKVSNIYKYAQLIEIANEKVQLIIEGNKARVVVDGRYDTGLISQANAHDIAEAFKEDIVLGINEKTFYRSVEVFCNYIHHKGGDKIVQR